jgi:para-aminobenzoate synthetase component I
VFSAESHKAIEKMNTFGKDRIPFLFVIDYGMNFPVVMKLSDLRGNILYDVDGIKNYCDLPERKSNLIFEKFPVSYDKYLIAFETIMKNIKLGNTYLLNLTFPTRVQTNFSLQEIFYFSNAKYKLCFKNEFVVFSPETFIKINDGKIFSHPMKGTIDASIEDAEEKLLKDEKELAEHNTIVDLIRNDLSSVAKNVKVEKFRYVEEVRTSRKTLLQTSSKISGDLNNDFSNNIGTIIYSLLPAGSISGAPKKKTVEIITEAENYQRNYFTGIFGIFDGTNLESAVMIRFIENIDGKHYFKSGGGITFMSSPESEYQEMIDKVYVPII